MEIIQKWQATKDIVERSKNGTIFSTLALLHTTLQTSWADENSQYAWQ